METNYIFVDYENVQSVDLGLITGKQVKVILVVGKTQTKVPWELVKQLMQHSEQVRVIETEVHGKNALDFVLACEVGVQAAADPKAYFHILSKDKGFDALVVHLRHNLMKIFRHESFAKIPILAGPKPTGVTEESPAPVAEPKLSRAAALPSLNGRVKLMAERITKHVNNRPKRKQTLLAHINSYFAKELSETELEAIINRLKATRVIHITAEGAVQYNV